MLGWKILVTKKPVVVNSEKRYDQVKIDPRVLRFVPKRILFWRSVASFTRYESESYQNLILLFKREGRWNTSEGTQVECIPFGGVCGKSEGKMSFILKTPPA
jgi:hypothetical protein